MSQISGSWTAELPTDQLSRELALAVVAQLDQVDFIGALADAVVRRMAGDPPAGSGSYQRIPDPGHGGSPAGRGDHHPDQLGMDGLPDQT